MRAETILHIYKKDYKERNFINHNTKLTKVDVVFFHFTRTELIRDKMDDKKLQELCEAALKFLKPYGKVKFKVKRKRRKLTWFVKNGF